MLTVLWRKPDGSEDLFPAKRIRRIQPDGEQSVPCLGKFVVTGADADEYPDGVFEIDIAGPFGAVFVMNESGQTVARYLATPPGR